MQTKHLHNNENTSEYGVESNFNKDIKLERDDLKKKSRILVLK